MKRFIYRFGVSVKEAGERTAHVRVFGVPLFRWFSGAVIGLGRVIGNSVTGCPVGELR